MRLDQLDLSGLLEAGSDGGIIRFAGQRAIILDAVAMGLLRKELIETVGHAAARGVLTRFGYAHGWRTAQTLRDQLPWDSREDWQRAGGRLHRLQGIVLFEPVVRALAQQPAELEGGRHPFAEAVWHESYEAQQHLLHLGRADEPVCWTLVGFASGYLSHAYGREIYCMERACRGRGDSTCRMVGDTRENWGPEVAPQLVYFQQDCLSAALEDLTRSLARTRRQLRAARRRLDDADGGDGRDSRDTGGMVARSASMRQTIDLARRAAQVDVTVLITGESGVGKERVARFIHERSPRMGKPFIAVNCGALSETLLESELFGHARGAFTGADTERIGLIEAASGGTLFLDEIGELSPAMQVKLLRVLAEREVRPVGASRSRPVDVRVLAATHRTLADDVESGRFRQDLFYRLRVVEVELAPLRERADDILPLARRFIASAKRRMSTSVTGLSPQAAAQLLRHTWPGNIRELENAIERALVLAEGTCIEVDDLPADVRQAIPRPALVGGVRPLREVEREYILAALEAHDGNRSHTAVALGIGRATLQRKLARYRSEAAADAPARGR